MAWFGWCSKNRNCGSGKGKNVGSIVTYLKGCGKAKLDVGKCTKTKHNEAINVYLDDNIVGTVPANNFRKVIEFNFKDGSKLEITEGEHHRHRGTLVLYSLDVTSCSSCCKYFIGILKMGLNQTSIFLIFTEKHLL